MKDQFLKKDSVFFLIFVFLSLFLLFGDQKGSLDSVRGSLERPVLGLEKKLVGFRQVVFSRLDFFTSRQSYQQEIARLQGQLRQLAFGQEQLTSCLEENKKIRRLLGAPLPPSWKFLPAKVAGIGKKMRLDQGQKAGVRAGMMVVFDNILIGKVVQAEKESSLVQTLNDPGIKIPVVIKKPLVLEDGGIKPEGSGAQARGLLVKKSGELVVDQILQTEDVKVGDLVMTAVDLNIDESGLGWLPDLVIGQVEAVLDEGAAIYKRAQVKPLVDNQELSMVFIVTDY